MSFRELFPFLIIAVLMVLLITNGQKDKQPIKIPEKENSFTVENPQPVIQWDTIYKDNVVEKLVMRENPVNEELLKKYTEAKDSLEQLKLYRDAITVRDYEQIFRDAHQTITVKSKITGTLLRQDLNYSTAEELIDRKNPANGLYLGLGVQINHTRLLQVPQPEINLSYMNDNEMYTLGVGVEMIRLNYKHKLF